LKNVNASAWSPLAMTLRTNSRDSSIAACVCESAFTPTAIRGGANDACVTQLIVAAVIRPSRPRAVSTNSP
jgi:hypothetical protein